MIIENNQLSDSPFKSHSLIFEQEVNQAVSELQRPVRGLILSGFTAGFGISFSALTVAVIYSVSSNQWSQAALHLISSNLYTVGFIIVIMGRTDLFTEYTTIALFPILSKKAGVFSLARLWGLVYVANMVGVFSVSLIFSFLGPKLAIVNVDVFTSIGFHTVNYSWVVILISALLAGWLMGLVSWLVIAARESISQAFFIWLITFIISLCGLHHVVVGAAKVLPSVISGNISFLSFFHFLFWTSVGNAIGGVVFAIQTRFSVFLASREKSGTSGKK